jgi:hypothetical protein
MPSANCPACQAAVEYPTGLKRGSLITCLACDEVFVPPGLEAKAEYDPEADEDTYAVTETDTGAADRDKQAHTAKATRGAARRVRELDEMSSPPPPKPLFDGPTVAVLALGFGVTIGLFLVVALVRGWDNLGGSKAVFVVVVLLALVTAGAVVRDWMRKNRQA